MITCRWSGTGTVAICSMSKTEIESCGCSDNFEEYVGQLQMATLTSIQVEQGGNKEMSRKEITDKLKPLQQVRVIARG